MRRIKKIWKRQSGWWAFIALGLSLAPALHADESLVTDINYVSVAYTGVLFFSATNGATLPALRYNNVAYDRTASGGNINEYHSSYLPEETSTLSLIPGGSDYISLGANSNSYASNFTVQLYAKPWIPGWQTVMGHVVRSSYEVSNVQPSNPQAYVFYISNIPKFDHWDGRAGMASQIEVDPMPHWQVALGSLMNGSSAGSLLVFENHKSPGAAATPVTLCYYPVVSSPEVAVYYSAQNAAAPEVPYAIRQVITKEAAVDVVTLSATSYELNFYRPSQLQGGSFPYTFSGSPYVTYTIGVLTSGLGGIGITSTTTTNTGTIARTATTTFTQTNVLDWTKNNWTSGAVLSSETSSWSSSYENEIIEIAQPGQVPAEYIYKNYGGNFLLALLSNEVDGSTASLATGYTYYSSSTNPGAFGHIQSITHPDGRWEGYDYYSSDNGTEAGAIMHCYRPFNNLPATPTYDPSQGEVTSYTYSNDPFGLATRPAGIQTTVNGNTVSQATITYTTETDNGMNVVVATRVDKTDATGDSLTTVTKYYQEDAADDFYRNQKYSVARPDGTKDDYANQRGDFDGTTFTADANGAASEVSVIHGTSATGTAYSSLGSGWQVDPVDLVTGKSTMETTIRDQQARIARTETWVWDGGNWQLLSYVNYGYDSSNELVQRTSSNGGSYTATYNGEQKTSEIDESGITTSYTYDDAGRVLTLTKNGATTTYSYDAMDRVTSQTVSGGGDNLVSAWSYDDAGRLISASTPGCGPTHYTYSLSPAATTATFADGGTRTETYNLDGRIASVTGTSTIPAYYTYNYDSTYSARHVGVAIGSSSSPREKDTWIDWLGRTIQTQRPGFAPASQPVFAVTNKYDPTTGLLDETDRTGSAPTLYQYDEMAQVNRGGLALTSGESTLNLATDRVTDTNRYFKKDVSGNWWLYQETDAYPFANSSTPFTLSTFSQRATGFSGTLQAETQTTDAEGNMTDQVVNVTRSDQTETITTTYPDAANSQVETIVNGTSGLTISEQGVDGLTASSGYDALGRPLTQTDSRNNTTTIAYWPGTTFPQSVTDAACNIVSTRGYDAMGRLAWNGDAYNHYTFYGYNYQGQLLQQWGDGGYPVQYGYDATYGDRTSMSTFRGGTGWGTSSWPANPGAADTTQWFYDAASGLLSSQTDASGQSTAYGYNQAGQLAQIALARLLTSNPSTPTHVTKSYAYDPNTGELTGLTYNDQNEPVPTPSVAYNSYTRLGQIASVTDATGTRQLNYDPSHPERLANETLDAGFYSGRVLTQLYDVSTGVDSGPAYGPYNTGLLAGRPSGFQLGLPGNQTPDLLQQYVHSDAGRFVGVNTGAEGNAVQDFVYNYQASSALVSGYDIGGASTDFTVSRGYEQKRDLLTSIQASFAGGTPYASFNYTNDARSQRLTAQQSGTAFADYYSGTSYGAVYNSYTYDGRGELQSAIMFRGAAPTGSPSASDELPGRSFEYRYDNVGNRLTAGPTGTSDVDNLYQPDVCDRYTSKENNLVSVLGNAASGANVALGGDAVASKLDRNFGGYLLPDNTNGPAQGSVNVYAALPGGGSGGTDLVASQTRHYFVPAQTQNLGYDFDGNLASDGVWSYTYDAENRLVRMVSLLPAGLGFTRLQLDFVYDYLGRRVEKDVHNLDGGQLTFSRRYLYDGWNLVAETDLPGNILRSYTWGLDATGTLDSAGGVGALLRITNHNSNGTCANYYPAYDGNGNIVALVASGGTLAAAYEYSPYGEHLRTETFDPAIADNPFGFSTKFTDSETGFSYYGLRYYSPFLGRFINRDPIGLAGGLNLYGFVGNDPVGSFDVLGAEDFIFGGGGDPSGGDPFGGGGDGSGDGGITITYNPIPFLPGPATPVRPPAPSPPKTSFPPPPAYTLPYGTQPVPDPGTFNRDAITVTAHEAQGIYGELGAPPSAEALANARLRTGIASELADRYHADNAFESAIRLIPGAGLVFATPDEEESIVLENIYNAHGLYEQADQLHNARIWGYPQRAVGEALMLDVSFGLPINGAVSSSASTLTSETTTATVTEASNTTNIVTAYDGAAESTVPNAMRAGQLSEGPALDAIGSTGKVVFTPTAEQMDSAAFRVIVGEPQFTATGAPVSTIYDGTTAGGLAEVKGGSSVLNSTYQLRLQTYGSLISDQPYTIYTNRPVNGAFSNYLSRWGASVQPHP
jgi:RHS repeat-associated protein